MDIDKKNLVWIASYPKSGNTWIRLLLSALLYPKSETLEQHLARFPIASNRALVERLTGLPTSEFTQAELTPIRKAAYKHYANYSSTERYHFLKIHDTPYDANQQLILPFENTRSVLYVVRNPLDIVPSWAYHFNISIKESVKTICKQEINLCNSQDETEVQLPQRIANWTTHFEDWTQTSQLITHVVRFEDLIDNQRSTFISALASLGLASNSSTIEAAFSKFSFQNMKETEDAFGFSERPPHTRSFFRAGKSNTYLNYLSKQQIDRIVSRHGETMEKLNYLP